MDTVESRSICFAEIKTASHILAHILREKNIFFHEAYLRRLRMQHMAEKHCPISNPKI